MGLWNDITSGAMWAGKAGVKIGAIAGAVLGAAAVLMTFAPVGIIATGLALIGGAAAGAVGGAIAGGIEYGAMGAIAGAVNGDPKAPARESAPSRAPGFEMAHEQEVASREFRNRLAAERAMASTNQR